MHLADAFIQSDLQCIQAIHFIYFFISMCVPWESNPQPFALLTQCSTTEPQEHPAIIRLWCFPEYQYQHNCNVTLILYISISINKKLKLSDFDFRQNIDCFCSISLMKIVPIKATAELLCVSEQHTAVFRYWMNPRFWTNRVCQWFSGPFIRIVTCLVSEWISRLNESIEWINKWLPH